MDDARLLMDSSSHLPDARFLASLQKSCGDNDPIWGGQPSGRTVTTGGLVQSRPSFVIRDLLGRSRLCLPFTSPFHC